MKIKELIQKFKQKEAEEKKIEEKEHEYNDYNKRMCCENCYHFDEYFSEYHCWNFHYGYCYY